LPPTALPTLPLIEPALERPPLAVEPPACVAVELGCDAQPAAHQVAKTQTKHVLVIVFIGLPLPEGTRFSWGPKVVLQRAAATCRDGEARRAFALCNVPIAAIPSLNRRVLESGGELFRHKPELLPTVRSIGAKRGAVFRESELRA